MRPTILLHGGLWLVALCACKQMHSLGANCPTPAAACDGKACGESCSACTTDLETAPDVVGRCSADGVCSLAAPLCAPSSMGGQTGNGSSGCLNTVAAKGVLAGQTITVGGQVRSYVLSVPEAYTGTSPLALVFAWHGANVDGELAREKIFNLESTSNGEAIFVYPDGIAPGAWDLSTGSADFQLFPALLSAISSSHCIDKTRVFSTGHSSGAAMSNALGCYFGDAIRAIAPVEGTPPNTAGRAGCSGSVAALIVHGENDPVFPIAQGQATREFWLSQNGCATQTAPWPSESLCVGYQGCQPDLPVVWCVHDEGHAWPTLGSDCHGGRCFEAGPAVWGFFSQFH